MATGKSTPPSTMARDPRAPSPDAVWPFLRRPLDGSIGYHVNGNIELMQFCLNLLEFYFPIGVLQVLQEWEVPQQDKAAEERLFQAIDDAGAIYVENASLKRNTIGPVSLFSILGTLTGAFVDLAGFAIVL